MKNSNKTSIYSGFAWSTIGNWGSKGVELIIFILFAKYLAPDDFGIFSLAKVFVDFVGIFVGHSFSAALIQKNNITKDDLDTSFWVNVFLGIVLFVLFYFLSSLISSFYNIIQLENLIRWLSISLIITSLNAVQQAILRRNLKFKLLAIRVLISEIFAGSVGVILVVNDFGINSLVVYTLMLNALNVVFIWSITDWVPSLNFKFSNLKSLSLFGFNIIGIRIAEFSSRRVDDLIIGYFMGPVVLGYYVIAYKILRVSIDLFGRIFVNVGFPLLSKLQNNRQLFLQLTYDLLSVVTLFMLPLYSVLSSGSSYIIPALFGEQWIESSVLMSYLAILGVIQVLVSVFRQTIISIGRPSLCFKISFLNTFLIIVFCSLSSQFNIRLVVFSIILANIISTPLYLLYMNQIFDFSIVKYFRSTRNYWFLSLCFLLSYIIFDYILGYDTFFYFILFHILSLFIYFVIVFTRDGTKPWLRLKEYKFV